MKYGSNRNFFLILSVFIIGNYFFNIKIPEKIPILNFPIPDSSNPNLLFVILTAYFGLYTIITWFKVAKSERSILDLCITLTIGFIAISIKLVNLLKDVGINWKNSLTVFVLLILGIFPAIMTDFIITALFSIRKKSKSEKFGLNRLPSAAKAVLRASYLFLLPVTIVVVLVLAYFSYLLPSPTNSNWLIWILIPTFLINFQRFIDILLCLGPKGIRKKALKRLRRFNPAFDLHEMHYQHGLVEKPKDYFSTELCDKSETNQLADVKKLLEEGANPNEQDGRGWSPLMWAAAENNLDIVKLLLDFGADPNLENFLNRTALMYASRYGYFQIVECLLNHKANINSANEFSQHPALLAAAFFGHLRVVELLIKFGADISFVNKQGKTALDCAMEGGHGHIAKILRKELADKLDSGEDSMSGSLKWIKKQR